MNSPFETMEHNIRFEMMTQEYLDEHYSRPEGVQYVALSGDMFSMESTAAIDAMAEFYTHPVTFDVARIREASGNGVMVLPLVLVSETPSAVVSRSEMLVECCFHDYTFAEITQKEGWSILYGSVAMPFGPFRYMFDGWENTDGWMSHIIDGFPNSQNLGNPYAVIDLGNRVMVGECGVLVGYSGWYDVTPQAVEFYVTPESIDPKLNQTEYGLINASGNWGNQDRLSDDYLDVHNRLKEFDSNVHWTKVATVSGLAQTVDCNGIYMVSVPQSVLAKQIYTRYVKVVVIPFPASQAIAGRTKISEVFVSRVATIDGESVN